MTDIKRYSKTPRASGIVVAGDRIETAGIVARPDTGSTIGAQTRCVLQQLEELLQQAGASKANLTFIQIWLADMDDFQGLNTVYDEWVADADQPARACVGSQLADDQYRIEIKAVGHLS